MIMKRWTLYEARAELEARAALTKAKAAESRRGGDTEKAQALDYWALGLHDAYAIVNSMIKVNEMDAWDERRIDITDPVRL